MKKPSSYGLNFGNDVTVARGNGVILMTESKQKEIEIKDSFLEIRSTKSNDLLAIISKGVFGIIPYLGPLVAEIVGTIIPNQRLDRIERLLMRLGKKVQELANIIDSKTINERLKSSGFISILEIGLYQAAKAVSTERIDYIASLLKNSLASDQIEQIGYKKLLDMLGQLNDIEILKLKACSYNESSEEFKLFLEKHRGAILSPNKIESNVDYRRHVLGKVYQNKLLELDLIRKHFKIPKKGEEPDFDPITGTLKFSKFEISAVGRLLLKSIDQHPE